MSSKAKEVKEVIVEATNKAETPTPKKSTDSAEVMAKKADELRTLLGAYPNKLTIAQLITLRYCEVEEPMQVQRTPSHNPTTAIAIIESAISGVDCGIITLGKNTETGGVCIVNGGSRTADFIDFYTGRLCKKDFSFKELTTDKQKAFLTHKLAIHWIEGTTESLARDFKNYNNNTALTGGQKAYVNLVGSNAITIVDQLKGHKVFNTIFTERNIQKNEPNNCIFLILSNILGCYKSSISKVTEELANKDCNEINVERLTTIFDIILGAEVELTKLKFVHLVHVLYLGECYKPKREGGKGKSVITFTLEDINNSVISIGSSVNYQTSGTNSDKVNNERIDGMNKKIYDFLNIQPVVVVPANNNVSADIEFKKADDIFKDAE